MLKTYICPSLSAKWHLKLNTNGKKRYTRYSVGIEKLKTESLSLVSNMKLVRSTWSCAT